jgi:cyanophycin synthetase
MRPQNTIVTRHRARGGTVYVLQDGWIVEATAGREHPLVRPAGIPATLGGMAEFQVANALAAVAACRALGATRADIIAALMTFRADAENPGRSNLYRLGAGHVLMDYGHNARALEAVCEMAARWRGRRLTAVLGMPGDRADWVSQQAAQRAATGFQRIIVREDDDLRGRAPGDMAALLERAIRDTSPDCECIVVRDSAAALETAVRSMQDGEIVVAFYEHLEPMLAVLERYHAVPVSAIPARDPSRSDGRQSQLPSRPISIRQNLATGEI